MPVATGLSGGLQCLSGSLNFIPPTILCQVPIRACNRLPFLLVSVVVPGLDRIKKSQTAVLAAEKRIATAGQDGVTCPWDVVHGDLLTAWKATGGWVTNTEVSTDGDWVLSESQNDSPRLWAEGM